MKKFFLNNVFYFFLEVALFFTSLAMMYSQTSCWNPAWPYSTSANVGIHSWGETPIKPLHIFGNPDCWDPAIRLSYTQTVYAGHLALITPWSSTVNFYSELANEKDLILQADRYANDLFLTTRNYQSCIKFTTTEAEGGPDFERMRITQYGKVGIGNEDPLGILDVTPCNWNCDYPRISFNCDTSYNPSIRFYRPTGTTGNCDSLLTFVWYIEAYGSRLDFKNQTIDSGATPGQEVLIPRLTIIKNGNVGINNTVPVAKLQVTNGSVLFNGTAGSTPVSGAGTRFMWIPEKAAIRAGYVSGNQWNTIGNYSAAFGNDCEASGDNSVAFGVGNTACGVGSLAFGIKETFTHIGNMASGDGSLAFGSGKNYAIGEGSMACGSLDSAVGMNSFAMGLQNWSYGNVSLAIGSGCRTTEDAAYSIAMGYNSIADSSYFTFAIGHYVKATGLKSTAMGNYVSTGQKDGSFIIGDHNCSYLYPTYPDNRDQMVMRFTGRPNDT